MRLGCDVLCLCQYVLMVLLHMRFLGEKKEILILVLSDRFQALIHGLNRHYYSITINYRKNELEQKVCMTSV